MTTKPPLPADAYPLAPGAPVPGGDALRDAPLRMDA